MSFKVEIAGHSNNPHDNAVLSAVQAALAELEKIENMSASVVGYTWSSGSEKIDISEFIPRRSTN